MTTTSLVSTPSGAPDHPRWIETLRDQTVVLVRPLLPTDRDEERRFLEGLSPQARRYRFLGQIARPSEALVDRLMDVDFVDDVAFVAVHAEGGRERIVGVARYGASPGGAECECAVTVADAWRNKGLGTTLMRHLIDVARARGMTRMFSIDAVDNAPMRELAHYLGFSTHLDPDDATLYVHSLALQSSAAPPL